MVIDHAIMGKCHFAPEVSELVVASCNIILSYSDMCMFAYNKIKDSVKFIVNKNSHPIKVSLDCFKNVKTVNFNDFPIRCKDVYSGLWIINPISLISRFGFISNH